MTSHSSTLEHKIVSPSQWLRARTALLAKEKELTRLSDELAVARRELPWTKVGKQYVFAGPKGKVTLADLFAGRSQLATYHFMFGPDWEEGCPGCSFITDHLNAMLEHLHARDVTLVLVSRAPLERLQAFERRMGWRLPWFSSLECDFNQDFGVTYSDAQVQSGDKAYNFGTIPPHGPENPGLSYFYKSASGEIFHTYSTYARGLDALLGAYMVLDRAPKGRDEAEFKSPMQWLRHHDRYQPTTVDIASCHK